MAFCFSAGALLIGLKAGNAWAQRTVRYGLAPRDGAAQVRLQRQRAIARALKAGSSNYEFTTTFSPAVGSR